MAIFIGGLSVPSSGLLTNPYLGQRATLLPQPDLVPLQCHVLGFLRKCSFEGTVAGTGANWNAVKDEWIVGSMPRQIELVKSILNSQIRKFSGLGQDNKFQTTTEYPEPAWYEAIV